MPHTRDNIGKDNAKVEDTDIQGTKAGKHNRAETDAGAIPPPAGESRPDVDPRGPAKADETTEVK